MLGGRKEYLHRFFRDTHLLMNSVGFLCLERFSLFLFTFQSAWMSFPQIGLLGLPVWSHSALGDSLTPLAMSFIRMIFLFISLSIDRSLFCLLHQNIVSPAAGTVSSQFLQDPELSGTHYSTSIFWINLMNKYENVF